MDTTQALIELGVTEETFGALFPSEDRHLLDEAGYVSFPNALTAEQYTRAASEFDRLSEQEGAEGGREVHTEVGARRVSNIFNKTDVFDFLLMYPPLLVAAQYLLGEFKLHGANLREPLPGFGEQDLHVDVGRRFVGDWGVLNALICFDDMNPDNGGTRIIPGSHRWNVTPGDNPSAEMSQEDVVLIPADRRAPYPGELYVTATAGSIIAINSSLWHSGTRNASGKRRRQLHLSFTRRDLPQQFDQRAHCTPELYARLHPAVRWILDIA
jgi:hypothetical protein